MTKKIIFGVLGVLAVVVIVLGVNYFSGAYSNNLGAASNRGINFVDPLNLMQGFFAGTNAQLKVSNAGALTIGSSGTSVSNFRCASVTWNPGSLATSSIVTNTTSTDITLPGAVMGDLCRASLTSATSTALSVACGVSGTATGTIQLTNNGLTNLPIDAATGTAKVCYTH